MSDTSDAVERFFATARATIAGGVRAELGSQSDVLVIAGAADRRGEFRRRFRALNDLELQEAIRDYLGEVLNQLEVTTERSDIRVDLLDRAALAPSAAAAVAGTAALLAAGGGLTPVLLAGGLIGLVVSGAARTTMKFDALRVRQDARQVRLLLGSLR